MIKAPRPPSRNRHWTVYASYVVTFGMVVCFAAVSIRFLGWIFPNWNAQGVLLLCALAALEAMLANSMARRLPTAQRQMIYYRVTEWLLILLVVKIFVEMRTGPAGLWNNLLLWPERFPANIFTSDYLLAILPVLAAWQASESFANDLFLLGAEDTSYLDERLKTTSVRDLILRRYLILGMLVIIFAAIPPQSVIPIARPVASNAAAPAILAYFILGLILLSLVRYASLETTWRQARASVSPQIPRRWFGYSALILGFLVLLVIWLPTNYGMGFFKTLNAVIGLIAQAVSMLYGLIAFVIAYLAHLLGRPIENLTPPILPEATPTPEETPPPPVDTAYYWNLLASFLFWAFLIILLIVALRQFIFFHRDLAEELKRFKPIRWLLTAWEKLKASFRKVNKSVGTFIQSSIQRLRYAVVSPAKTNEWDYINPRRLDPRQKILFYYLALVRRARESGLPRQEGETPYEYARTLTDNLEEGKEGVEAMTESFIEARYTRHEISAKQARRTQSIWETMRRVLRDIRKSRQ